MIDCIEYLESRGYNCIPSGEHNVFIECPFHAETDASCSVSTETGGFHCFGCGKSGSFVVLIAEIDGIDSNTAQLLLGDDFDVCEIVDSIEQVLSGEGVKAKRRFIERNSYLKKFPELSGAFKIYAETRKLNDAMCTLFDIRSGISGKWRGRMILPLKNIEGKLVGFTGRAIYENPFLKMRTYVAYENAVNDTLFGLYESLDVIRRLKYVILVEGPIDCIYMRGMGFPTVARLGVNPLSEKQVLLLVRFVDRVLISYDGDKSGYAGIEKEYTRLHNYLPTVPVRLPDGKDQNSMCEQEIKKIYAAYV